MKIPIMEIFNSKIKVLSTDRAYLLCRKLGDLAFWKTAISTDYRQITLQRLSE